MSGSRGLAAFAFALAAAINGGATAQVLSLEYRAYLLGVGIASASAQLETAGDQYRVRGRLETKGMANLFSPWIQEAISAGQLDDAGSPAAQRHWQSGSYKGEARHIDVRYALGRATITSADPDPDDRRAERRVPPELTAGTTDPLSGLLTVAWQVGEGRGCTALLPVFDGRHRYDVAFRDGGRHADGAVECRFLVEQLAGFKKKDGIGTDPSRPGRIWFKRMTPGLPPIPVRAELGTRWGKAVVELVRITPGTTEAAAPSEG